MGNGTIKAGNDKSGVRCRQISQSTTGISFCGKRECAEISRVKASNQRAKSNKPIVGKNQPIG